MSSKNLVLSRDASGKVLMRVITNPQAEPQPTVMWAPPHPPRSTRDATVWLGKHADFVNEVYDLLLQYIQGRVFPDGQILELDSSALRDAVKEYVYSCST